MDNQTKLLADLLGQSEFSLVDHYLRLLSKNYCVEQRVEILKERLIQTEILFSQEKKQYQQEIDKLKQKFNSQEKKHADKSIDRKLLSKDEDLNDDFQICLIQAPIYPDDITDGMLNIWHTDAGKFVSKMDVICEIETDTVILELVAPDNGFIKRIIKNEGDIVSSGEGIAEFVSTQDPKMAVDLNNELSKGVWVDPETKLMWARISIGQEWENGECSGNAKELTLGAAKTACQGFKLAGFDDWRLPNINELKSLIDEGSKKYRYDQNILFNPLLSTSGWYWSSTYVGNDKYAYLNLYNFHSGGDFSGNYRHVRAVRGPVRN